MKTKQEVEAELMHIGDFVVGTVFTTEEFAEEVESGYINGYDGVGYLHDGEKRTDISCWKHNLFRDDVRAKYPYVIWFNK